MKVPEPTLTPTSSPVPPSNGCAVDLAGEVDDDAVALLDLGALAFGRVGLVLLGDLVERLVDLGVGHLGDQALELDAP